MIDRFREQTFFGLNPKLKKIFSHICKELENKNSRKRHKIWSKLYCPQIFLAGTAVPENI